MADQHLILDASAIIDMWLDPNVDTNPTAELFKRARETGTTLWVCASALSTLEFVTKRRLKDLGAAPDQACAAVGQFMSLLLRSVQITSAYGFEQADIYIKARDFEDAQIAASARCLQGARLAIVTLDNTFDTLDVCAALSPAAALDWLRSGSDSIAPTLPFIDLAAQQHSIRPLLEQRIETVLRHGQYIMGPEVRELETRLEAYTGAKHCITVASGTEALLISMMALGIGPGDEVITTPFTFVATAEVIVLLGAKPVFIDIEPDTCNIDATLIEAAITPRTKAIMPVSLYGQPADMDEINAIAARHDNIPVIEDAAQSFGAEYKGRKSCNLSTIGCTSFFPSKPLGCYGDGGAIFTSDDAIAQACREIRVHGQSKRYVHTRIGVGGRMDTLQCAVVLAKLERFDWEVDRRIELGVRYNELLDKIGFARVVQRNDRTSVFGQFTVLCDDREKLQSALQQAGIPTAVHYPVPLNEQPAYKHLCCSDCTPVAKATAKRVMSIPMSADMSHEAQELASNILATNRQHA